MIEERSQLDNVEEGFTLIEFFNSLRKNFFLLLVIVVATVGLGIFYTWSIVTPKYSATIGVSVQPQDTSNAATQNSQLVTVFNQVLNDLQMHAKTNDVLERVIHKLEVENIKSGYKFPSDIKGRISTSRAGDALSIYITYEDEDPILAQKIAVEIFNALEEKVNSAEIFIISNPLITSFDIPKVPQAPTSPNKMLNVVISCLIGGIIGVVVVILKEQFNNKFTSKDDLEKTLGLPVFATIPNRIEKGIK